jgi:SAM-dependent methyltransferase
MANALTRKVLALTDLLGVTSQIPQPRVRDFVSRNATEATTLDLGCGAGPYADYFPHRIGFDVQPGPAVHIVGDAHDLGTFEDEQFECVLCSEVLEHLHTPTRAIDEIHRVLKPGGRLILTTRFIFPIHEAPGDYYRYTKYGLRHLLQCFEILEIEEESNTLEAVAVLYQRIGFQCRTLGSLLLNIVWFVAARITQLFSFVITREYGSKWIGVEDGHIMTTGYYVLCEKPIGEPNAPEA